MPAGATAAACASTSSPRTSSPTCISATLDVLDRTGVYVETEEAQEIFAGAGARVESNGIVHIPGHVVEDAIRSTPSRLVMYGRDPKHDIVLEDGRVGFTNFGEGINVIDPYSGELRQTTKQDVADCSRIIDALPEIDVIERPLGAHDVPEIVRALSTTPRRSSPTARSPPSSVR